MSGLVSVGACSAPEGIFEGPVAFQNARRQGGPIPQNAGFGTTGRAQSEMTQQVQLEVAKSQARQLPKPAHGQPTRQQDIEELWSSILDILNEIEANRRRTAPSGVQVRTGGGRR